MNGCLQVVLRAKLLRLHALSHPSILWSTVISIQSFAVLIVGTRVGLHGFFWLLPVCLIVNSIIMIESHKVGNGLLQRAHARLL